MNPYTVIIIFTLLAGFSWVVLSYDHYAELKNSSLPFRAGHAGITPPVSFGVCVKIRKKIAKENQCSFLDDINL